MTTAARLVLGAPNIYRAPEPVTPVLAGVRMDVCAFVGVAPRGPVRIPIEPEACAGERALVDPAWPRERSMAVAIESWDEYQRIFGGFEGPGRLPYAVASFFEQGGRRAYVVRVVHEYGNAADNLGAVAQGELHGVISSSGTVYLNARSEGGWGNRLQASLGYSVTPVDVIDASTTELAVGVDEGLPPGSLLRLTLPTPGDDPDDVVLRFVSYSRRRGSPASSDESLLLTLETALPVAPKSAELVEGDLLIDDGAGVRERFNGLGLCAQHPRWLATVLYNDSALLYPHHTWVDSEIKPLHPRQLPVAPKTVPGLDLLAGPAFSGGDDRYAAITHDDFFDSGWTLGDARSGSGVHALTRLTDLSSVVVADLYQPEALPQRDNVLDQPSLAGAHFAPCVRAAVDAGSMDEREHQLSGLLLDPADGADLEQIILLQQRLVTFAESLSNFVVLLDVPPGLSQKKILRWRSRFRSSYLAAYYPWLNIATLDDGRDALIRINPAATAAGIIAKQELAFGVPHGPANVIATGVVKVDERISPARHNELHPLGINVYLQQRDGVWLSAGRTLSRDKHYRQLSVRRFMLMLRRALNQQMHWMVFEPNGPALWSDVRHMLNNYLRRFYLAGAFRGNTEEEAFFVHCDSELNTRRIVDAGRMICDVGVAVAEPLEFIVVRITRGGDGTLAVEG